MQFVGKGFFKKENDSRLGCLLFVVVLLVFLPAVFNGFTTYDDPEYVTANLHVQAGLTLDSFLWAFRAHGANWHPLTWLSHILDGQLFGLAPQGHHLGNVLLHALNTLLVFRVLKNLTGKIARSFAVAILFGLHPLRVESVAWIAERKDVLSAFFWLLSLLAYISYVRQSALPLPNHRRKYFALALFWFALGLLSKSMVVTLPCVLLLLDFWPLQRFQTRPFWQLALEKIPFFLLSAAMSLIAYFAQYHGTALVSDISLSARFQNVLISYCRYLGKIFWPQNLCAIYPYPAHWPILYVTAAAALLVVISIFVVMNLKRQPYLAMGWCWFLGTMVPVIGLVQVGNQSMADRYTYLPCLGILIAVVWGIGHLTATWPRQITVLSFTLIMLAGACIVLTEKQITYWKDTESLYRRAVAVTQNNIMAEVGLGSALADRGDLDDAITVYHRAVEISPHYYEAHYNLGLALMDKGQLNDAITEIQTAMQCRPGVADSSLSLGVALARKGDIPGAQAQFEEAVALDPSSISAHANLGKMYVSERNFSAAAKEFQLVLNSHPDDPQFHYDLASAYLGLRRFDDAIAEFRTALKFTPNNPEMHNDLGTALANQGQLDAAIAEFQTALKINPQHTSATANLAKALSIKSKTRISNDPVQPSSKP